MIRKYVVGILFLVAVQGCDDNKGKIVTEEPVEVKVEVPVFNADSAYNYVARQVAMGPRIPGTAAHLALGDYIVATLEDFGATVTEQLFTASTYDGQSIEFRNIIGSMFPERPKRILLAAHWDTRPFADKDKEDPDAQFEGANDGASGVAVLLEIARQLSMEAPPEVGVDFAFFDGEDWGERIKDRRTDPPEGFESWWCLGSQYWSQNKHIKNYSAYYGILVDMVGAKGSQFHIEGLSKRMAPRIVNKVWDRASSLGYGGIFVKKTQAEILDDHVFINNVAKIPMVNIVHYDPELGYFGDYHHSRKDNLENIDPRVLGIVGSTVLNVLFYE